jgi:glycerophosphoryl diester phosphodiesterase
MSHPIVVIAHRGASGYLPEHTLEGKALAYGQGADYLEQDVVATRDDTLIVLHDIVLEQVTDVAQRFPERRRADGHWYAIDFDIDEIRQLVVLGRARPSGQQPRKSTERYRIPTLEEELTFVRRLNDATGRRVGVYPEIKHPRWHRSHGIDLARLMTEQLARFGYSGRDDLAYVQCFDAAELRRVRDELGCALPLIQLVEDSADFAELLSRHGLQDLSRYAQGLGPSWLQLLDQATIADGGRPAPGALADAAREQGLLLHPYTFKREGLPAFAPTLEALLELFYGVICVDGVFCDFPDVAVRVRGESGAR